MLGQGVHVSEPPAMINGLVISLMFIHLLSGTHCCLSKMIDQGGLPLDLLVNFHLSSSLNSHDDTFSLSF